MMEKDSNCDEIQKLNWWQNSKTQTVTKLKNSNCDKTQKLKLLQNSNCDTTQIVTKFKLGQNSYCHKTPNVKKKLQNSKFEEEKKLQNSKCDKIQIVTKLENSNHDKTQKLKYEQYQFMKKKKLMGYFSKNIFKTFTTDDKFSGQRFAIHSKVK